MSERREVRAEDIARAVRGQRLMCRTSVLLLGRKFIGRETDAATRLNLDPVDYRTWKQGQLVEGQRYLSLTRQSALADLDTISELPSPTDALLVFNFDLALSYLEQSDRQEIWRFLRESFRKRRKGLVVTVPADADLLVPGGGELQAWFRDGRIARMD
jgi:hypothetical protein